MSKVTIRRLETGIPGLDDILGGGLPELSFNVIAGGSGSGKTTLAHQLMFALATTTRTALYFTALGEPPIKMIRHQQQYSFFDETALTRSIQFINLSEEAALDDFNAVLKRILVEVERHRPAFVVVDSIRAMPGRVQNNRSDVLRFTQDLGTLMAATDATTFVVGDYWPDGGVELFPVIADGLLWLHQSVERNSMVRKIEIVKMRGQPTVPGLHTFRISQRGLEIFAPPKLPRASRTKIDRAHETSRLSVGVALLDRMLGGGLPRGYSLLVAGPSGSGKSILSTAFLLEGARVGEKGVIAAFEQRSEGSRDHALTALIDADLVGLVDSRAPDLSIDEVANLLISEITRLKASRVVIDSLSGFELAIAPTFRLDFRQSMARLVGALASTGVTVLMTCELEDRYDDLRFSPHGTAFLADAIIVQRYMEIDSRLQRMIAVAKVRASAHSNELYQFSIDDDGIHIGTSLPGMEGLLSGRPSRSFDGNDVLSSISS